MAINHIYQIEDHHGLKIVRDDHLPGGTKQRGLALMLAGMAATDIIYPGTVLGYGALALTHACHLYSKRAHIFISDDGRKRTNILKDLENAGAILHIPDKPAPLSNLVIQAQNFAKDGPHSTYLPPGFHTKDFKTNMIKTLETFPDTPQSLWVSAVSGTMASILSEAFPQARMNIVTVAKHHNYNGRGQIYNAPEKYHHPAKTPPSYPSFSYCDAKVWQFAREHARPGDHIWNMGA